MGRGELAGPSLPCGEGPRALPLPGPPASVDTHPVAQVPSYILQDAFGHVGIELVTRDLRETKEAVNRGAWGSSQPLPGSEEGTWVLGVWKGIGAEVKGEPQITRKSLGEAARGRQTGWGRGTWKACE